MGGIEEQEYALAHPPKKFLRTAKAFGYMALIGLTFGVAAGALGITSYFLQKYGNIFNVDRYPDRYTMRTFLSRCYSSFFQSAGGRRSSAAGRMRSKADAREFVPRP